MSVSRKWWQAKPGTLRPSGIALVLLLAICGRLAALVLFSGHLSEDRDAYWGLAQSIADGQGFSSPGSNNPTAFRPPLYPILLAVIEKAAMLAEPIWPSSSIDCAPFLLGVVQLVIGLATVYLSYRWANRLGLPHFATAVALLVAIDPLLIQYTTFAMTETLFTLLVTLLMFQITTHPLLNPMANHSSSDDSQNASEEETSNRPRTQPSHWKIFGIGLMFGLCALCRPTILAYAGVFALWLIVIHYKNFRQLAFTLSLLALGGATMLAPWTIRNWIQIGKPIATTTHGGYTLLLGNNPVFYEVVVDQPWGTVWHYAPEGKTQTDWITQVKRERREEIGLEASEVERDQWMYRRARQNIRQSPGMFLKACKLRFLRFWNVVPHKPARTSFKETAAIGIYYSSLLLLFVVGIVRLFRRHGPRQIVPLLLLCVAITLVHSVYWSNMRMRAPLTPAIAIIAMSALQRRNGREERPWTGPA